MLTIACAIGKARLRHRHHVEAARQRAFYLDTARAAAVNEGVAR